MKQTILIFAAMFILMIISGNSVQAQTVVVYIGGQRYDLNATTLYNFSGYPNGISGADLSRMYPAPAAQPAAFPAATGVGYMHNSLVLQNQSLQNAMIEENIKTSRTQRGLNIFSTAVNGLAVGFQTYNNTRVSGSTVNLLNSQSNYLNGLFQEAVANNGQTVTPPMPGGNPVFNPPGGTIWYDNNDGMGTFYMLNGYRVYTVAPPGSVINGQYAGQTPTYNGQNSVYNQQHNGYTQRTIDQMYFTGNMNSRF